MPTSQPRVAAIGLNQDQVDSIRSLCGSLRSAATVPAYLENYAWSETDIVVASGVHLIDMTVGPHWLTTGATTLRGYVKYSGNWIYENTLIKVHGDNTEREVSIPTSLPTLYGPLARMLTETLNEADTPPTVVDLSQFFSGSITPVVKTTSNRPVAARLLLELRDQTVSNPNNQRCALILPEIVDLSYWMHAFLTDVHSIDPSRVPHEPPRMSAPSDWFTPDQRDVAAKVTAKIQDIANLQGELKKLQEQLVEEGTRADNGVRRAIWLDSTDLVGAVSDLLSELGFSVQDMDANRKPTDPKVEDLRLTLPERPNWEAIVEVKGYANGVKTNDSRQINEHVKKYIEEKGRHPDLIVWLSNPFRRMDPSLRPVPDSNVEDSAIGIRAVHVLSTDLYRQWSEVGSGAKEASEVVNDLAGATPGLWNPSP